MVVALIEFLYKSKIEARRTKVGIKSWCENSYSIVDDDDTSLKTLQFFFFFENEEKEYTKISINHQLAFYSEPRTFL